MGSARFNLRPLFWLIIGLYAVSFILPAWGGDSGALVFLYVVFLAPLGILSGESAAMLALLGWLANPVFWYGVYLLRKRRWRRVFYTGTVAALLALSVLPMSFPGGFGLAYYVWLASMVLLSGAGLIGLRGWWSDNGSEKEACV